MSSPKKCFNILSVEDNSADRLLIQKFLPKDPDKYRLYFTENGFEAIDFLKQRGIYSNAERPDLILLDLNLPKKDGKELLREIKADVSLKNIPVFVFSTSTSVTDESECLELGAVRFITKPGDISSFQTTFENVRQWLEQLVPSY